MGKLGKVYDSSLLAYKKINSERHGKDMSRARKGFVPMLVGRDREAMERLQVPTKLLDHPYIVGLLEVSADEFGYGQQGPVRIQCDAEFFKQMVKKISKEISLENLPLLEAA